MLPPTSAVRAAQERLDRSERRLTGVRRLAELYQAYTQAELVYADDNTLALHRALDPADQELFGCDVAVVDWEHYLVDLHCPAVTGLLRWGAALPPRPRPARAAATADGSGRVVAAFDMDGTLLPSTVVEALAWVRLADAPPGRWPRELSRLAAELPRLLAAERRSRASVVRTVTEQYAGADVEALAALVDERVGSEVLARLSPAAVRVVREHRAAGHRTVLVTGALDVFTRPLHPLFDEVLAAGLEVGADGRATGRLSTSPVVGEARAAWLGRRAATEGWDLADSAAYADSMSDLPMLQAVGRPVAVNPDVPLATPRPAGEVAGRALGVDAGTRPLRPRGGEPMRQLQLQRSLPRYLALRAASGLLPSAATVAMAPLRLGDAPAPALPGPGWARVRPRLSGICGSDLATVTGQSSIYLSPLVSWPFTPGHEVVGDLLDELPGLPVGTRVVLDPVLSCRARGLPECASCSGEQTNRCARVTLGHLSPGLQTGYCRDTGGGWSAGLVAHASQLLAVPDDLPDARAVLNEPLACAVHVARRAFVEQDASVLVVGAGTVGLLVLHALRALTPAGRITVVAKHPRQAEIARALGADEVVLPKAALSAVRRSTGAVRLKPERGDDLLLGGVDVAVECTGSSGALGQALRSTRAGGRVVLAGMPPPADLTPAWFRELEVVGSYAATRADHETALGLLADPRLDALRTSWHPLSRYAEALDEAGDAGRLGLAKVGFDLTEESA